MAKNRTKRTKSRLNRAKSGQRKRDGLRKRTYEKHEERSHYLRKRKISDTRFERGLRVYSRTKDIYAAARSIGISPDRFKQAVLRKTAKRKRRGGLAIVHRLPRRMPIFTEGRQLAIVVRTRAASLIGRHTSAVGQFFQTNEPKYLAEFVGRTVKDVKGRVYPFETDPNVLYRLSSAGNEPFEEIYRIVI